MNRRAFLASLAAAPFVLTSSKTRAAAPSGVNAAALRARIEALSVFGRPAGGTFADGVSRTAYSAADLAGRAYVMDEMRAAGLAVRVDAAGNIYGRREGTAGSLPPILFGSHIDSVPSGGNFDGDLGSLSALSVLETLAAAGLRTRHPLEMVVWAHEESFAFGRGTAASRIVAGQSTPAELAETWNGMTRAEAIRRIGGNPDRIQDALRANGSIHGYLELHIEQGGTLDKAGIPVGVVEGIVAIDRYDVVVTGFANHAGTTPIAERQDALLAASHLTIAVREAVKAVPGRQVGTVGHIEVTPNSPNVIPGLVKLSVELRDLASEKLDTIAADIRARAARIAADTQTTIALTRASHSDPAIATPSVQDAIERASAELGLKTMRLPSGAGHDAQNVAKIAPMGMIFVPSVGGVSHSPKELTRWEDCANGANVLLGAVLQLDRN